MYKGQTRENITQTWISYYISNIQAQVRTLGQGDLSPQKTVSTRQVYPGGQGAREQSGSQ